MALGNQEPVRLYAEDDARLPKHLARVIQDRIDGLSESVLSGQLTELNYRSTTGQITGLKFALSECERIVKDLSGN